jgi:hypothetical protein
VLTGDYVYIAGREERWLVIGKQQQIGFSLLSSVSG